MRVPQPTCGATMAPGLQLATGRDTLAMERESPFRRRSAFRCSSPEFTGRNIGRRPRRRRGEPTMLPAAAVNCALLADENDETVLDRSPGRMNRSSWPPSSAMGVAGDVLPAFGPRALPEDQRAAGVRTLWNRRIVSGDAPGPGSACRSRRVNTRPSGSVTRSFGVRRPVRRSRKIRGSLPRP